MAGLNERGAGRKKTLNTDQIEKYIERVIKTARPSFHFPRRLGFPGRLCLLIFPEEKRTDRIFRLYSLWAKLNREFEREIWVNTGCELIIWIKMFVIRLSLLISKTKKSRFIIIRTIRCKGLLESYRILPGMISGIFCQNVVFRQAGFK